MKPRTVITAQELNVIDAICNRARIFFPERIARDLKMDIVATHLDACPLELDMLLDAPDTDFIHDIAGIERHLNRSTIKLEDAFSPRFAKVYHSQRARR